MSIDHRRLEGKRTPSYIPVGFDLETKSIWSTQVKEVRPPITPELIKQIRDAGFADPVLVPVVVQPGCIEVQCWKNVEEVVRRRGGTRVTGRIVWAQVEGRWLHFEAHAVWQLRDGSVVDPTPQCDGERTIVFVPQELDYKGMMIESVYVQTDDRLDTKRFLEVHRQFHPISLRAMNRYPFQPTESDRAVWRKWVALVREIFPEEAARQFPTSP